MKNYLFPIALCLLTIGLYFSSCARDEDNTTSVTGFTISAAIPTSRTQFQYDATNKKVSVLWVKGDAITLIDGETKKAGIFTTQSEGSAAANFTSSTFTKPNTGDNLYAFYPSVSTTGASATFNCSPQKENESAMYSNTIYAGTTPVLQFHNAMALLKMTLSISKSVSKITSVSISGNGLVCSGTLNASNGYWSSQHTGSITVNNASGWTVTGNKITVYVHVIPQGIPVLHVSASDGSNTFSGVTDVSFSATASKEYPIEVAVSLP